VGVNVGMTVGDSLGTAVGEAEGTAVGTSVGDTVKWLQEPGVDSSKLSISSCVVEYPVLHKLRS
jgi:hypothetical protein